MEWVWPETITSMPSTDLASSSSSEDASESPVPLWDRQTMISAPSPFSFSTQRRAASAASVRVKPEVGAHSSESTPISPNRP